MEEPPPTSPMSGRSVPLWFLANVVEDEERTYSLFGRFVAAYALAESGLHIAVRHFSGMPDEKARIVFAGMRHADIVERLRALIPAEKANELESLLDHLSEISEARNQFVHRLIEYTHGVGLSVTNKLTCKSEPDANPRLFSREDLECLEFDCRLIFDRLILLCDRTLHYGVFTGFGMGHLFATWRYKPIEQDSKDRPSRGDPGSPPRPPRTSRASQEQLRAEKKARQDAQRRRSREGEELKKAKPPPTT
jgi:hypothetical protein